MQKLIITVALTGNVPTKDMNPDLPVTADEIAADVRRCADAGAVLFHVHARDADQQPTLDIDAFKERSRKIKAAAPEVIIQLSTGAREVGRDIASPDEARTILSLNRNSARILRSLLRGKRADQN